MALNGFFHVDFEHNILNDVENRKRLSEIFSEISDSSGEFSLEKITPEHLKDEYQDVGFEADCFDPEIWEIRTSHCILDLLKAHISKYKLNAKLFEFVDIDSDNFVCTFENGELVSQYKNHPNYLCYMSSVATPYLPIDRLKIDDPNYCYYMGLAIAHLMGFDAMEYLVSKESNNKVFIAVSSQEKPYIVEWDLDACTLSLTTPECIKKSMVVKPDWMLDEQLAEAFPDEIEDVF